MTGKVGSQYISVGRGRLEGKEFRKGVRVREGGGWMEMPTGYPGKPLKVIGNDRTILAWSIRGNERTCFTCRWKEAREQWMTAVKEEGW